MAAFGSVTALTGGAATLNASSGQQFFWIQNLDTTSLIATFKDSGGNVLGQKSIGVAPATDQSGETITSQQFPTFLDTLAGGSIVLAGTGTAHIASGASTRLPQTIATVSAGAVRSI